MWKLGLENAGLDERDENTRYLKRRIHSLRSFFNSQLKVAGVSSDIVEHLMGHEGYLTGAYRKYTIEQLADDYSKGEYAVIIYGGADLKELNETREEISNLTKDTSRALTKILDQDTEIERLKKLSFEMAGRMGEMQSNIESLQVRLDSFESTSKTGTPHEIDEVPRMSLEEYLAFMDERYNRWPELRKRLVEEEKSS